MNVMAKAHELTRTVMANAEGGVYATIFKHCLKHFHKEYKAMQSPFAKIITDTESYIAKLEAALLDNEQVQGFIIVIGEGRICSNAELGYSTNVLNAPIYMHLEDAEYYASRVQNGLGEKGEVVGKYSQLKYEVEQQKQLLESLKKA